MARYQPRKSHKLNVQLLIRDERDDLFSLLNLCDWRPNFDPHAFHFTIRDLLLTTVIAALAVGWWMDHRSLRAEIDDLRILFHVHPNPSE